MKLLSSRYETNDFNDAVFLCRQLGVRTAIELEEQLLAYFSLKHIQPRVQSLIDRVIEAL
jgi:hypothetical protein